MKETCWLTQSAQSLCTCTICTNKKKEQYTIKDFAFFVLGENWKVDIFEELLRESKNFYLYSKHEDNKNIIVNRALYNANENYGLNGAYFEDSFAWEQARDSVL